LSSVNSHSSQILKKAIDRVFFEAAKPDEAIPRYEEFLQKIEHLTGRAPAHGTFAADMQVALINDGPVTILIDSQEGIKATSSKMKY
jgi:D-tyrosyl-tRNA(Tyr) deacylase